MNRLSPSLTIVNDGSVNDGKQALVLESDRFEAMLHLLMHASRLHDEALLDNDMDPALRNIMCDLGEDVVAALDQHTGLVG